MQSITNPEAIADLVERVGQSLVRVDGGHRWGGTGTVYASDLIVTANHVVERDEGSELGLPDGTVAQGTVVGRDPTTGIALVKTDAKGLVPATFRSLDGLRVGHFAVNVGRPGKTVRASFGIVRTLGDSYRTPHGGSIDRYLESDAEVPPGWSGGLMVDLEGKALGLSHRGLVRSGAVALPYVTLERVLAELRTHGKVRRGHLGVGVHPVRLPESTAQKVGRGVGIMVNAVEPKSPAEASGILLGDVIVALDGTAVEGPWELASQLRGKVDVEVTLSIVRAGELKDITAKV